MAGGHEPSPKDASLRAIPATLVAAVAVASDTAAFEIVTTPREDTMTRIYVGNLNRLTTADQLHRLFQKHGSVRKAGLLRDAETGVSRGFGYVLMGDDVQAGAAIEKLHRMRIDGSVIVVKNALPAVAGNGAIGKRA